jgi:phage recombination protein Bet
MVNNSLAAKKPDTVERGTIEYECNGETVKLSPSIVKDYLVSGNGAITGQEIVMFLNLCRFQHLNPFLREAYLIKFGNSPATMVTGKEVFTKRAKRNKDYKGFEAGIIVQQIDGTVAYNTGTFKLPNDILVGGWSKIYINDFEKPVEMTVSIDEYIGTKSNGEVNSQWQKKPATMIRKVALVQALREAFPEDFQGMYSQEEVGNVDIELNTTLVEILPSEPAPEPITATVSEPQEQDPLA